MEWIIKIIIIGIIISIARKKPIISFIIAILSLIIYNNFDFVSNNNNATEIQQNITPVEINNTTNHNSNTLGNSQFEIKQNIPITNYPEKRIKKQTTRIGAICRDGSRSRATGRGACSHHGGVSHWLYE